MVKNPLLLSKKIREENQNKNEKKEII